MARKTLSLPDSVEALVREQAEEGESFSAAATRLILEGAKRSRRRAPPRYVGSFEGPRDFGEDGGGLPPRNSQKSLRVVVDTGPLVAAANVRDEAHGLAAALVTELGREAVVLDAVAVEVDHLLRSRRGPSAARLLLQGLVEGEHQAAFLTPGLLKRAVEFDERYADLDLGLVDASVMAYAERHRLPILTFDFEHFRATQPARGYWRLVVDEARYREATER